MKAILFIIISGALSVSGYAQTRNVLVGTNNTVVQPTNFWSVDASNARTGLGLGSAATNPATAFQSSSSVLSNLASSNAINLTNIRSTNIVGVIPSSNIPTVSLTNLGGTLAVTQGGTGATNAGEARTNLGLGWTALTNTNSATSLMGLVLEVGTTNEFLVTGAGNPSNFIIFTNPVVLSGGAQGLRIADGTNEAWDFPSDAEAEFYYAFGFYGANASNNAATTRTNLGLPLPALTNVSNSTFNTAIGLGITNNVQFNTVRVAGTGSATNLGVLLGASNGLWGSAGPPSVGVGINGTTRLFVSETVITASAPIGFDNTTNAATTRTNLGLAWSALTNSNAGTGLVSVNTNGEVVSPTNFWQVSPANTRVQVIQPVVNATNNATNARNLFLYSLSISTTGVTNTIQLPTNGATLLGDVATVIHEGPTSSITAVRQTGSGTNIITMNQFQEAVKFIYETGGWRLADNLSFVEAIYFSGTNAAASAAASRTNLGLGASSEVVFESVNARLDAGSGNPIVFNSQIEFDDIHLENIVEQTRANLGLGAANNVRFGSILLYQDGETTNAITYGTDTLFFSQNGVTFFTLDSTEGGGVHFYKPFSFIGTNAITYAAISRTNLGLGGNNNVTFSNVTASGALTATSTVTAKTNLIVEGRLDFTTNATNSNPATNNHIQDFIEIRVGTNQFWLPLYK